MSERKIIRIVGGSAGGVRFETWLATTTSVDVRDNAGLHHGRGREEQRRDGCEEEEGRGAHLANMSLGLELTHENKFQCRVPVSHK